jgi:hypothetical protein
MYNVSDNVPISWRIMSNSKLFELREKSDFVVPQALPWTVILLATAFGCPWRVDFKINVGWDYAWIG